MKTIELYLLEQTLFIITALTSVSTFSNVLTTFQSCYPETSMLGKIVLTLPNILNLPWHFSWSLKAVSPWLMTMPTGSQHKILGSILPRAWPPYICIPLLWSIIFLLIPCPSFSILHSPKLANPFYFLCLSGASLPHFLATSLPWGVGPLPCIIQTISTTSIFPVPQWYSHPITIPFFFEADTVLVDHLHPCDYCHHPLAHSPTFFV